MTEILAWQKYPRLYKAHFRSQSLMTLHLLTSPFNKTKYIKPWNIRFLCLKINIMSAVLAGTSYCVVTPETYHLPTTNPSMACTASWLPYHPMYIPIFPHPHPPPQHQPQPSLRAPTRSISCQVRKPVPFNVQRNIRQCSFECDNHILLLGYLTLKNCTSI